jgi:Flp pilus assembly pilin Flp
MRYRSILIDSQGVAITEYALIILCIALVMADIDKLLLPAIHEYLKRIIFIVSLPIP